MVVDGVELLRMIRDGEIRILEDRVKCLKSKQIYYLNKDKSLIEDKKYSCINDYNYISDNYTLYELANLEFEIISEEDKEIDIDSITEMYINNIKSVGESETKCWTGRNLDIALANKINEIIKAVKQLDKEMKRGEE